MKGADPFAGFGGVLRGREGLQRMMAAEADKQAALRARKRWLSKEETRQVICLWGVGTGKSRLLAAGLESHKRYCVDPTLATMLSDEKLHLQIQLSFNSRTSYTPAEGTNGNTLISRRLIAAVTGLPWGDALQLPLSDALTASTCLTAIARQHRVAQHLNPDVPIFIFVGVDEVNKLMEQTVYDRSVIARQVAEVLRTLRELDNMFVATAMAGTHVMDISDSFLGSGIHSISLPYSPLSKEVIKQILVEDAGVSAQYMEHADFQQVLLNTHPVLRPLGEAVACLPILYDAHSVRDAQLSAVKYFSNKTGTTYPAELERVLEAALTGELFSELDIGRPLAPGSSLSLDSLQNRGALQMMPASDSVNLEVSVPQYQVSLPMYQAQAWARKLTGPYHYAVKELLKGAKGTDFISFKLLTARWLCMKFTALRRVGNTEFTMDELFPTAISTPDLVGKRFRIPAATPLVSPDDVMWLGGGKRFPPSSATHPAEVYRFLEQGGLLVNAPGALTDVLAFVESYDEEAAAWVPSLVGIAPKHTLRGMTKLSLKDVNTDQEKVLATSLVLQAPHNTRTCTTVSFSNRELTVTDKEGNKGEKTKLSYEQVVPLFQLGRKASVIVEHTSIGRIVGPVLSNLLSAHRAPARHFSTLSAARVLMTVVRRVFK